MTMNKDTVQILALYVFLFVATALCVVPVFDIQNIGYSSLFFILIGLHILHPLCKHESLLDNHVRYMISSLWIWNLFVLVGAIIAGILIAQNTSPVGLEPLMRMFDGSTPVDEKAVYAALNDYIRAYQPSLLDTVRICLFPSQIFLIYRLTRGSTRAVKSYRVSNPPPSNS